MNQKVALISGGTRGIGTAIALALREAGCRVAVTYQSNEERAEQLRQQSDIEIFKWDVSDYEACQKGIEEVNKRLGPIDILINNAGITRDKMFHTMVPEDWSVVIATNLLSCFHMSHLVIDSMRQRNFGRIINISSINAQRGQRGQTNYCAAKAGILGFTKALALENARKGITVNAICPGYINTEMVQAISPEIMDKIVQQIPIGRLGEGEDIARCVVFLASQDAEFITGSTISINGGHHMD